MSGAWPSEVTRSCAVVLVDGKAEGTAVLVTPDRAFTCAHVVATRQETGWRVRDALVQLRFGGRLVEVDAGGIVIPGGDDLAVVTLEPAEGLPPLSLWPAWRPPEAVKVFGFPLADRTRAGVWRDFTVSGPTTSGLVQLRHSEAAGSLVGQSGGPVVDDASGRLVGLLQEGSEKGVFDRYLPVREIARVWPELRLPWAFAGTNARAHVESRGRGQRSRVSAGDLFCGRDAVLGKIRGWLDADIDPGRVLVVTGQPGAGKSAVLSRAVLLAQDAHPGVGLVFHARHSTHSAFCEALAEFVGASPVHDGMDLVEAVSRRRSAGRLWVMVDALDEASTRLDRHQLASTLKELAQLPGVRVVVATRPLTTGSMFAADGLVCRLGATSAGASNLVNLDQDPYRDPAAVQDFALALLTRVDLDPPSTASQAWIHYRKHAEQALRLAHAIANRAADNFLVAALAATYFAELDEPVDADDPSVLATMPSSVGEALDKYLDSQPDDARRQVSTLLRAVAYGKGDGITDGLWLGFASAISGHRYEMLDLDALRDSPLADFLLETSRDTGHVVTRLFHQALVDQLMPTPRRLDLERAILSAVRAEATSPEGWAVASPYALQHAAQHASDAEQLPVLLEDVDFVIHAHPERLIAAILTLPPVERPPIAVVFLQAGRRLAQQSPKQRAAFLSLAAAHLGLPTLSRTLHDRSEAWWQVEWAHSLGHPHQPLTGHTNWVTSVAVGRLAGRDVIVSGSYDRTVRLWDAAGQPIGEPLTGHTSSVTSVAVGRLGGRDVIVSGSDDTTVRLWDAAGQPIGEPLTSHTSSVMSVAVGRLGGRDVIVSGSYDRTVRLWDAAGQPIGEPLDLMEAVGALTLSRGRLLVATGIALVSLASVGATIRPNPRNDR